MQLYKGTTMWYDDSIDDFRYEVVYGFAKTMVDFIDRIDKAISNIKEVQVKVVNCIATDSELLYVDPLDFTTQRAIEKENDY